MPGSTAPTRCNVRASTTPPPDASPLPGLEAAGTVAAVGPGVARWSVGDAVTALLPGGGYAEYVTTHADHALPVPEGMPMDQAAALCETFFTVWSNVFRRGELKAGERFLVHGGSSGIGTTAIQLAHLRGARVFTTAGSADKCNACLALGAEAAWNYREVDFVDAMRAMGGADVILDMVGGDYLPRNVKALADDGRLVQIAFLQGPKVEMNFTQMMTRRLTLTGSTLRPQSVAAKAAIARDLEAEVWPHLGITPHRPGDGQRICAGGCGTGPCADGRIDPYREDRAEGGVTRRAFESSSPCGLKPRRRGFYPANPMVASMARFHATYLRSRASDGMSGSNRASTAHCAANASMSGRTPAL